MTHEQLEALLELIDAKVDLALADSSPDNWEQEEYLHNTVWERTENVREIFEVYK